jgi:hypothetical protein
MSEGTVRERIRALVEADPDTPTADLARAVGVSKQRVHQILKKEGLWRPWRSKPRVTPESILAAKVPKKIWPAIKPDGCPQITVTSHVAGTIAELLVACDLMARGWQVFFPMVRVATKCDLIALDKSGERQIRIEVRSSKRDSKGTIVPKLKPQDVCDHHAYVIAGEPVLYKPPLE